MTYVGSIDLVSLALVAPDALERIQSNEPLIAEDIEVLKASGFLVQYDRDAG